MTSYKSTNRLVSTDSNKVYHGAHCSGSAGGTVGVVYTSVSNQTIVKWDRQSCDSLTGGYSLVVSCQQSTVSSTPVIYGNELLCQSDA